MREGDKNGLKRCSHCGLYKQMSDFHKHKSRSDGLANQCKDCDKEYYLRTRNSRLESAKLTGALRRKKDRELVLNHYGNRCNCCPETTAEFLGVDHIDGGGNQHRKQLKSNSIYRWLVKNNYPDGFQLLCHNCNMAKAFYGECPHKRDRKKIAKYNEFIKKERERFGAICNTE